MLRKILILKNFCGQGESKVEQRYVAMQLCLAVNNKVRRSLLQRVASLKMMRPCEEACSTWRVLFKSGESIEIISNVKMWVLLKFLNHGKLVFKNMINACLNRYYSILYWFKFDFSLFLWSIRFNLVNVKFNTFWFFVDTYSILMLFWSFLIPFNFFRWLYRLFQLLFDTYLIYIDIFFNRLSFFYISS